MKGWKIGVLALALLGTVSGCLPTQRELSMERDLEEMKRRLAENEKGVVGLRKDQAGESRIDVLARRQADMQAGLDALRVELQSVNGRLEDMSRRKEGNLQETSLLRDDLNLKITALEERLGKLEEKVQNQAALPPPAAETPQALYERGLDLIQQKGEYAKGRQVLTDFLERNPHSDLTVNAMYWIGEAYYGENKYESAILQFQDVIQKYGDHPKAASALLKQGLAFQALGDTKNAKVILQKVVDAFPLSEEARKAKERLAAMKIGK